MVFVDTNIESWQKGAKPAWYTEDGGFFWTQLTGTFKNAAPGKPDHLDNCDGEQAIWLFAVPEVALFQDYNSVDWNDPEPSHKFNARYRVGKSYNLSIAVNGGGGGMKPGVTLQVSLYFRDVSSNIVTVASTAISNSFETFPNHTHLTDFSVSTPIIKPNDPWADAQIGIQLLSTVDFELQGGYWDIDNVRLEEREAPILSQTFVGESLVSFKIQSDPGSIVEVLTTTELGSREPSWIALSTLTNATGSIVFTDQRRTESHRFYMARRLD